MSIFKCKMCGGTIEFEQGATVGICDSCGTKQTLPRLDDDKKANLYDRANHFRRNNDYDKAMGIYEQILNEDNTDAEAYWSLVLCRYGIEYVKDPSSHKQIPTINRAQYTSVFADEDYKSALQYADFNQKIIYEDEAKAIDEIQKGILAISQKEEPFDVFICYKDTDSNGRRTQDSVLANDLYHLLKQEGFKVFFSRITLEDKLGIAYEPYIFAALNSSKVMVVLGTKPEYFNAVWVKNEWSRYLSLIKSGAKKTLIPAYRDMDPYDLPEEFSHLQALDMSKLGFMQDLIRGIKKIISAGTPKVKASETQVNNSSTVLNTAPLLRRAFIFLEDGNWKDADKYCEKVLDRDPENAIAYLGKLMAEFHVRKREQLQERSAPLDVSANYIKVLRFADEALHAEMQSYNKSILYNNAKNAMLAAGAEDEVDKIIENSDYTSKNVLFLEHQVQAFESAADMFANIQGFEDADVLRETCIKNAKHCYDGRLYMQNKILYNDALDAMRIADSQNEASKIIESYISVHKDSPKLNLTDILSRFEKDDTLTYTEDYDPIQKDSAKLKYIEQSYKNAAEMFTVVNGFEDADTLRQTCLNQASYCYNGRIYILAKQKLDSNDIDEIEEAIKSFQLISGWKDSDEQVLACKKKIAGINAKTLAEKRRKKAFKFTVCFIAVIIVFIIIQLVVVLPKQKYNQAMDLLDSGNYDAAYALLEELGYRAEIKSSKYNRAKDLITSADYEPAYMLLKDLNYRDSETILNTIKLNYLEVVLRKVSVGDTIFWGSYEQDTNLDYKEAIEWIVLAKENEKALIISKYALDCQMFNSAKKDITWEKCSLRSWMNKTFLNDAFSPDEQAIIATTNVSADKNPEFDIKPGKATKDKIFLLSITEAEKYFTTNDSRQCAPTDYAKKQGAYTDTQFLTSGGEAACRWWLRTPGNKSNTAAYVEMGGSVMYWGPFVDNSIVCVRPAMWINLDF